jgi:hypothetical protein
MGNPVYCNRRVFSIYTMELLSNVVDEKLFEVRLMEGFGV